MRPSCSAAACERAPGPRQHAAKERTARKPSRKQAAGNGGQSSAPPLFRALRRQAPRRRCRRRQQPQRAPQPARQKLWPRVCCASQPPPRPQPRPQPARPSCTCRRRDRACCATRENSARSAAHRARQVTHAARLAAPDDALFCDRNALMSSKSSSSSIVAATATRRWERGALKVVPRAGTTERADSPHPAS